MFEYRATELMARHLLARRPRPQLSHEEFLGVLTFPEWASLRRLVADLAARPDFGSNGHDPAGTGATSQKSLSANGSGARVIVLEEWRASKRQDASPD